MTFNAGNIAVIPTVEPNVSLHILPATIEENGLCVQVHNGGIITGRAYVAWKDAGSLEDAIRQARGAFGDVA